MNATDRILTSNENSAERQFFEIQQRNSKSLASAEEGVRAVKGSMKEYTEPHRADDRDLSSLCGNNRKDGVKFQETSYSLNVREKKGTDGGFLTEEMLAVVFCSNVLSSDTVQSCKSRNEKVIKSW